MSRCLTIFLATFAVAAADMLWLMRCLLIACSLYAPMKVAALEVPPGCNTPQLQLFYATCANDAKAMAAALEKGAKIDLHSEENFNALHYAIYCGNREVFQFLLERGADVDYFVNYSKNFAGTESVTPLGLSIILRHNDMAKVLLTAGADSRKITHDTEFEFDAFAFAALYGNTEMLRLLVNQGRDANHIWQFRENGIIEDTRYSPIGLAAQGGHLDCVRYLVEECKVSVNSPSTDPRQHPLFQAAMMGCTDVCEYLLEQGADVNPRSFRTDTKYPLAIAASMGHTDVVRLLLKHGARDNPSPQQNLKAAYAADEGGQRKILELLEAHGFRSNYPEVMLRDDRRWSEGRPSIDVRLNGSLASSLIGGFGQNPAGDAAMKGPRAVAILSVDNLKKTADLVSLYTTELSVESDLQVLERESLDAIINELKLDRAQLKTGNGLAEVSRLSGADYLLLLGTASEKNTTVASLRVVDAHLGVVSGVRYFDASEANLKQAATDMRAYAVSQFAAGGARERVPVSLVNVRSTTSDIDGVQAEKLARCALEVSLSKSPGLLLLQREQMEQLAREAGLRGAARQDLMPSGAFINVRVDIDEGTGALQGLTVKIDRQGQRGTEDLKLEANGRSLPELVAELGRAISDSVAVGGEKGEKPDLLADAQRYFEQAEWLTRTGLHAEGAEAIRTALSLGFNELRGWQLYLHIMNQFSKSRDMEGFCYAEMEELLAIEEERLYALDGLWRFLLSDAPQSAFRRLGYTYNCYDDAVGSFVETLEKFNRVSQRRKYSDEFSTLERMFLQIVKMRMVPLMEKYSDSPLIKSVVNDSNCRSYVSDILAATALMTEVSNEEIQHAIQPLLRAHAKQLQDESMKYSKNITNYYFKRSFRGADWNNLIYQWIEELQYPLMALEYATQFKSTNLIAIRDYQQMDALRLHHLKQMSDHEKGRTMFTEHSQDPSRFLFSKGIIQSYNGRVPLSTNAISISREYQKVYLKFIRDSKTSWIPAEYLLDMDLLVSSLEIYNQQQSPDMGSINGRKELQKRIELFRQHKDYSKARIGKLPVKLWHPSLYGCTDIHPAVCPASEPIFHDGKWYVLMCRSLNEKGEKSHDRYLTEMPWYLFKIDPKTLEHQVVKFRSEHLYNRFYKAAMTNDHLVLYPDSYDLKLPYSRPNPWAPIISLNLKSFVTKEHRDYVPDGGIYAYRGEFYAMAEPISTYDVSWNAVNPPDSYLFMKFDPESGRITTIANTRRNPPVNLMDKPDKGQYDLTFFPEGKCFRLGKNYLDLDTGVIASEKPKWRVNEAAALRYTSENTTLGYLFNGGSVFAGHIYYNADQELHKLSSFPIYIRRRIPDLERIIEPVISSADPKHPIYLKHLAAAEQHLYQNYEKNLNHQRKLYHGGGYGYVVLSIPKVEGHDKELRQLYGFFTAEDFQKALEESDDFSEK